MFFNDIIDALLLPTNWILILSILISVCVLSVPVYSSVLAAWKVCLVVKKTFLIVSRS